MKIAILTLHPTLNFGCILQALALQRVLTAMGHEVATLDVEEQYRTLPLRRFLRLGKRVLRRMLGRRTEPFFLDWQWDREQRVLTRWTRPFLRKYLREDHYKRFRHIPRERYEALVVGSDQVWRPEYFGGRIFGEAFLAFAWCWRATRRVAYAASFGKPEWTLTARQTRLCACLAQRFDRVAVREADAVGLCRRYLGVEATQVLDPTLLLGAEAWSALAETEPRREGVLMCYILDKSAAKTAIVERLARELGLTPLYVGRDFLRRELPLEERVQEPVERFLAGFRDAAFVVTDSFHGSAFAINFHRPFVAIGNRDRGQSRFTSLMGLFALEGRLVGETWTGREADLTPIDWADVEARHASWREKSLRVLREGLEA